MRIKKAALAVLCLLALLSFPLLAPAAEQAQEIGKWEATDKAVTHYVGSQEGQDDWKAVVTGPAGVVFKLTTQANLTAGQNYELVVNAALEGNDPGRTDPAVMSLSLSTMSGSTTKLICKNEAVLASEFEDSLDPGSAGSKELSFLFTLPLEIQDDKQYPLIINIGYTGAAGGNPYNLIIDKVRLNKLTGLGAEKLTTCRIVNMVTVPRAVAEEARKADSSLLTFPVPGGMTGVMQDSGTGVVGEDTDGDGIPNRWEVEGYYYDYLTGKILPKQAGVPDGGRILYYYTDPNQWSSDGDPYSDYMEVSGVNMDTSVTNSRAANPLVPAYPKIIMKLVGYTVDPIEDITISSTKTKSKSESWEDKFDFTVDTRTKVTSSFETKTSVEAKYNLVGVPEAEASTSAVATFQTEASLEMSAVATLSTNQSGVSTDEWVQASTINPNKAANIKLKLQLYNDGVAPVKGVTPECNVKLGGKIIAVIKPSAPSDVIAPGHSYPDGDKVIQIDKDKYGSDITITLDELKAIEAGAPVYLEPVLSSLNGNVLRWNNDSKGWDDYQDWNTYINQIDTRTALIKIETPNGKHYENRIYAGTEKYSQDLTLAQALALSVGELKEDSKIYVGNEMINNNWRFYFSDWQDVERQLNRMPDGQKYLMEVKLKPGDTVIIKGPSTNPNPVVEWASYNQKDKKFSACVTPGEYDVKNVVVTLKVNGNETQVVLESDNGSPIFYNKTPCEGEVDPSYSSTAVAVDVDGNKSEPCPVKIAEAALPALKYVSKECPVQLLNKYEDSGEMDVPISSFDNDPGSTDAYVVLVESNGISSDIVDVNIKGVITRLGTSDSRKGNNAGAEYSPFQSHVIVVPKPVDKTSLNITWSHGGWCKTTKKTLTVYLLGYFKRNTAGGGLLTLYDKGKGPWTWQDWEISGQTRETGVNDATGYIVEVTTDRMSSDVIPVTVNGVTTSLGTSDYRNNGKDAGAKYSPAHSHVMFVPAMQNKSILEVSYSAGAWRGSRIDGKDATPKVQLKILGYFSPSAGLKYELVNEKLGTVKGAEKLDSKKYQDPKAYLLNVTFHGSSSDLIRIGINGVHSDFATSATDSGNGDNPNPAYYPAHSHLMLVPADSADKFQLKIDEAFGGWVSGSPNLSVDVLGYFH